VTAPTPAEVAALTRARLDALHRVADSSAAHWARVEQTEIERIISGWDALAAALAAAQAENARWRMLADMAAADVIFFADSSPFLTGGDGRGRPCVLCNDEFAFACADAEPIPDDDVAAVHAAWKAHGNLGPLAWVCIKRDALPVARAGHEKDALHLAKVEAVVAALRAAARPGGA
jgi:hypothetical protein